MCVPRYLGKLFIKLLLNVKSFSFFPFCPVPKRYTFIQYRTLYDCTNFVNLKIPGNNQTSRVFSKDTPLKEPLTADYKIQEIYKHLRNLISSRKLFIKFRKYINIDQT